MHSLDKCVVELTKERRKVWHSLLLSIIDICNHSQNVLINFSSREKVEIDQQVLQGISLEEEKCCKNINTLQKSL
jgi:hypothetical protein